MPKVALLIDADSLLAADPAGAVVARLKALAAARGEVARGVLVTATPRADRAAWARAGLDLVTLPPGASADQELLARAIELLFPTYGPDVRSFVLGSASPGVARTAGILVEAFGRDVLVVGGARGREVESAGAEWAALPAAGAPAAPAARPGPGPGPGRAQDGPPGRAGSERLAAAPAAAPAGGAPAAPPRSRPEVVRDVPLLELTDEELTPFVPLIPVLEDLQRRKRYLNFKYIRDAVMRSVVLDRSPATAERLLADAIACGLLRKLRVEDKYHPGEFFVAYVLDRESDAFQRVAGGEDEEALDGDDEDDLGDEVDDELDASGALADEAAAGDPLEAAGRPAARAEAPAAGARGGAPLARRDEAPSRFLEEELGTAGAWDVA